MGRDTGNCEGRYGGDQDIIFKHGLGDAHWTGEMPNKQSDMSLELRVQGQSTTVKG